MKAIAKIDANGMFVEDLLQDVGFEGVLHLEDEDTYIVSSPVPSGLYRPKWDFDTEEWTEGLTQAEIDELNKPRPDNSLEKRITDLEDMLYDLLM